MQLKRSHKLYKAWYILAVACLSTTMGLAGAFLWTFFLAYSHTTKQVIVDVNKFGEADIEFVVFPLVILIGFIALYRMVFKRRI